ncbi:hypothetical protein R3P38DRAFT_2805299 [Favolaschia claudopus]|uniref:Uncharacterized protein n=1 Tax=Favolaschia claudopus TaxID=2862362 RepID=A0AAV9ZMX4_9AGAR
MTRNIMNFMTLGSVDSIRRQSEFEFAAKSVEQFGLKNEVIAQRLALEEAKKKEEVETAAKKTRKEVKKAEKAEIEERWKKMLAVHVAVEAWEVQRARLREAGTTLKRKTCPRSPRDPSSQNRSRQTM